jgi:hypothetical protein
MQTRRAVLVEDRGVGWLSGEWLASGVRGGSTGARQATVGESWRGFESERQGLGNVLEWMGERKEDAPGG